MLEYIQTYATSVESPDEKDKSSKKALELYEYLNNNKDGLLPYHKCGISIPEPKEGLLYKDMGIQENQNCTVITLCMKHRRMRWSVSGANNMAKALYRKENRELIQTIDRYTDGLVFTIQMQEIVEILSAAKAPKKYGKGNPYADIVSMHMPIIEVETEVVAKFINKWNLYEEDNHAYSNTEYEQIQEEHPLNMDFHSKLFVNDTELRQAQDAAYTGYRKKCMPEDLETETEAKWVLEHYGYDYEKAWAVHRVSYPWAEKKPRTVRNLEMLLEREMVNIPSKPFPRSKQGNQHQGATSVGIIGLGPKAEDGEDYYHPDGNVAKLRVCCSSLYFDKPEKIEWKLTFREKRVPDIGVKLI